MLEKILTTPNRHFNSTTTFTPTPAFPNTNQSFLFKLPFCTILTKQFDMQVSNLMDISQHLSLRCNHDCYIIIVVSFYTIILMVFAAICGIMITLNTEYFKI